MGCTRSTQKNCCCCDRETTFRLNCADCCKCIPRSVCLDTDADAGCSQSFRLDFDFASYESTGLLRYYGITSGIIWKCGDREWYFEFVLGKIVDYLLADFENDWTLTLADAGAVDWDELLLSLSTAWELENTLPDVWTGTRTGTASGTTVELTATLTASGGDTLTLELTVDISGPVTASQTVTYEATSLLLPDGEPFTLTTMDDRTLDVGDDELEFPETITVNTSPSRCWWQLYGFDGGTQDPEDAENFFYQRWLISTSDEAERAANDDEDYTCCGNFEITAPFDYDGGDTGLITVRAHRRLTAPNWKPLEGCVEAFCGSCRNLPREICARYYAGGRVSSADTPDRNENPIIFDEILIWDPELGDYGGWDNSDTGASCVCTVLLSRDSSTGACKFSPSFTGLPTGLYDVSSSSRTFTAQNLPTTIKHCADRNLALEDTPGQNPLQNTTDAEFPVGWTFTSSGTDDELILHAKACRCRKACPKLYHTGWPVLPAPDPGDNPEDPEGIQCFEADYWYLDTGTLFLPSMQTTDWAVFEGRLFDFTDSALGFLIIPGWVSPYCQNNDTEFDPVEPLEREYSIQTVVSHRWIETLVLNGYYSADNQLVDVKVNGVSVAAANGFNTTSKTQYFVPHAFTIVPGEWIEGVNTITFVVRNDSTPTVLDRSPTGLCVMWLQCTHLGNNLGKCVFYDNMVADIDCVDGVTLFECQQLHELTGEDNPEPVWFEGEACD